MGSAMGTKSIKSDDATNAVVSTDPSDRIKVWLRAGHVEYPGHKPNSKIPGWDAPASNIADYFAVSREHYFGQDAVRNGVKTGAETVSMQIRVLKTQSDLLKAAAFLEKRPASAILRQVLAEYFEKKCADRDLEKRQEWIDLLLAAWEWEE